MIYSLLNLRISLAIRSTRLFLNVIFRSFLLAKYLKQEINSGITTPPGMQRTSNFNKRPDRVETCQREKVYFSSKHRLYGFEVEVTFLPTGQAIKCTPHYPLSVADLETFQRNIDIYRAALKSQNCRVKLRIWAPLRPYPNHWGLLID